MIRLRKKNKESGFSLIEIMIASIVFVIGVVGLYSVFALTRTSSDASERELQAAIIGKQILEEMRAKIDQRTWNNAAADPIPCTDPPAGEILLPGIYTPAMGALATDFGGIAYYSCEFDATGAKKVTVRIEWNEP